jgi:5-methylcytosine-specific restriction enzyme A
MIREAILRTLMDYPSAREEEFSGHPVAEWIRHEFPRAFQAEMAEFPDITWVASPGQGRWADASWVTAFDPLVTETAQEDWYPV